MTRAVTARMDWRPGIIAGPAVHRVLVQTREGDTGGTFVEHDADRVSFDAEGRLYVQAGKLHRTLARYAPEQVRRWSIITAADAESARRTIEAAQTIWRANRAGIR